MTKPNLSFLAKMRANKGRVATIAVLVGMILLLIGVEIFLKHSEVELLSAFGQGEAGVYLATNLPSDADSEVTSDLEALITAHGGELIGQWTTYQADICFNVVDRAVAAQFLSESSLETALQETGTKIPILESADPLPETILLTEQIASDFVAIDQLPEVQNPDETLGLSGYYEIMPLMIDDGSGKVPAYLAQYAKNTDQTLTATDSLVAYFPEVKDVVAYVQALPSDVFVSEKFGQRLDVYLNFQGRYRRFWVVASSVSVVALLLSGILLLQILHYRPPKPSHRRKLARK